MTKITVTLPWPPAECSPNWCGHWRKRAKIVEECKAEAALYTLMLGPDTRAKMTLLGIASGVPFKVSYKFCRPDNRRRDLDNFTARCKPYLDGICSAFEIDDSRIKQSYQEWGDKHPGGQVIITLEVME